MQVSLSPGFVKQIMPVLFILCYNGSLVNLNGRKLDRRQI
jgi:hypothetical protein